MEHEKSKLHEFKNMNEKTKVIDFIFPDFPNIDKNKLQLTNITLYSAAGVKLARKLCEIIYEETKSYNITVTDMTANVGSETIMLALYFRNVNSIEFDKTTYDILVNNVNTYQLFNIRTFNDNSAELIKKLVQDVLYMDPPWGGQDYMKTESMDLYLGSKNIVDIISEYIKKVKCIVIRLPINYNFKDILINELITTTKIYNIKNKKDKLKFCIAVLK